MAGRKRKPGQRYPGGQLKRPTLAMIAEADRGKRLAEIAVVLAQPHRKGSRDERCASALGRFCMTFGLASEVIHAAEAYAALLRRWRAAKGIPTPVRLSEGHGDHDPDPRTVQGWAQEIARLELAVARATHVGFLAMRRLVLDDEEIPPDLWLSARAALIELAAQTGHMARDKRPYLS